MLLSTVVLGSHLIATAATAQVAPAAPPGHATRDHTKTTSLNIGDAAPSLAGVKWLAGTEIAPAATESQPGKVTIVAFWASWSAASREAMGVLSRLGRELDGDGVRVAAVCVWPRDKNEDCAPLVAKWSTRWPLSYGVDSAGDVASRWLDAAGRESVPMAFVVGGDGKIAWIGSPFEGLGPIARRVVKGTLDAATTRRQIERCRRLDELAGKSMVLGALTVTDELLAEDGELFGYLAGFKFRLLLRQHESGVQAFAFAREALRTHLKDNPEELNALANAALDHKERDVSLSLEAAQRAADLLANAQDESASVYDTLGRARYENGEVEAAVAAQTRAVELAEEGRMKRTMQKRLEKYEAAMPRDAGPPKLTGQ